MAKLRKNQSLQLEVWRKSVELLSSRVDLNLNSRMANPAVLILKKDFEGIADLEDFLTLCKSQSVGRSWAFRLSVRIHGFGRHSFLAYIGHRSFQMISAMGGEGGPSLYWSIYDEGYERKWRSVTDEAPFFKEATISLNAGDNWTALTVSNTLVALTTAELAEKVSIAIESRIAKDM